MMNAISGATTNEAYLTLSLRAKGRLPFIPSSLEKAWKRDESIAVRATVMRTVAFEAAWKYPTKALVAMAARITETYCADNPLVTLPRKSGSPYEAITLTSETKR